MKKRCYIAGAGDFCPDEPPEKGDYVIAADGGYAALAAMDITPDLVVGDFDSIKAIPEHPNIIVSPAEKDDTDVMLAVRQGFARAFHDFIINGGLGGRLDHTLANLQVLAHIVSNNARGVLVGRPMSVTAVCNGSIEFSEGASGVVSVFSFGGNAEGVTLSGLKYPLDDATLTCGFPLGVSNEFTGAPASLSVRAGTLIVIWESGCENAARLI